MLSCLIVLSRNVGLGFSFHCCSASRVGRMLEIEIWGETLFVFRGGACPSGHGKPDGLCSLYSLIHACPVVAGEVAQPPRAIMHAAMPWTITIPFPNDNLISS